ncbi:MAG: WYL domain-containing protein, partial [Planctomycetes bacterium]|nr:WYL domain-containing protein [Planctomycetota bacterium]
KTHKLEWREDGSLDFHVSVDGLSEISWWILGYGDQAEVIQPAELRQILSRRIEQMGRIYGKDGDASKQQKKKPARKRKTRPR